MQLEGVRPEQHIKSRVCPLIWVGKSVKMWKPELSRQDEKSQVRGRLVLSRWILEIAQQNHIRGKSGEMGE